MPGLAMAPWYWMTQVSGSVLPQRMPSCRPAHAGGAPADGLHHCTDPAASGARVASSVGALPMYLGLDLRGGVHFLLEVDMASAQRRAEDRYVADLRSTLREAKIRYRGIARDTSGGITVTLRSVESAEDALKTIREELPGLVVTEGGGGL